MPSRALAILMSVSCVTGCYTGDSATLSSTPTVVDSTPTVFAPPNGAPAHGPRNRVTICVAPQYHLSSAVSGPVLVREDGSPIVLRVFVVFADAPRRPLELVGYSGCPPHGFGPIYSENVPEARGARAQGVEVSANGPVQIESMAWWSGDPRRLPNLP
jgi:hypothetical protein